MDYDKGKIDGLIKSFAEKNGQTEEEVTKSFEEMLDKFCSDGEKGKSALKYLGFDERPAVEDFIAALAANPVLMKLIRKD